MASFILDLDGVLRRGSHVIEGAPELLEALDEYVVVTNNSTRTSEMYAEELQAIGLPIPSEKILTSARATALFLKENRDYQTAWVVGEKGLLHEIRSIGLTITAGCQCVVVGYDRTLTYEKLETACLAIRGGAEFIGTNPDLTYPSEKGIIPGCGSILAFLQACTDRTPLVIGKPNTLIMELALEMLKDKDVYVLGDRLDTDIQAGINVNLKTILVMTGVETEDSVNSSTIKPDFTFETLDDVRAFIRQS
ncbi:MAG: HAD-IIA family hydrolase [Theionarchaea archaeon]|nr:HAD-IIA family hydrolase [Theionarchaea archaeon]MBU7034853.1 HAD-IIA family hydrolase [Theionarchaea archaeon]MBU7040405.1 HAD-IIA family hydrolase [Theionarchaea archaeon]